MAFSSALFLLAALPVSSAARDYYGHPLYHIGLPGRPFLTQVTSEGWVNNGAVEFLYLTGTEMSLLDDIAITPSADGRPLLRGRSEREGLRYDFEYFAAPLIDGPRVPPQVDVVRVVIRNMDKRTKVARFWAGMRAADAEGRCHHPEEYLHWGWLYDFRRNVVAKELGVVAAYPLGYTERFSWPGHVYDGRYGLNPRFYKQGSAHGIARYDFLLRPGQDTSLVFLYPSEPGPPSYAALLNSQDYPTLRRRFDRVWDGIFSRLPDLQMGDSTLTAFVRQEVVLSILQTTFWGDRLIYALNNKNTHPFPELLEYSSLVRAWHRLGMAAWEAGAMEGLRGIERPTLILASRSEGRASTAGVLGLVCERALDSAHPESGVPGDTLALRADSLAAWMQPDQVARSTALECGAGAWALRAYGDLLGITGRGAEAEKRHRQSREAFEAGRRKLLAIGPSVMLRPDIEALPWMAEAQPLPADLLDLLKPGPGWRLQEGLVTAPNDTALVSASLARMQSMAPGSSDATQTLLAVAAHATLQGGLPAGIDLAARDFHDMTPPNAWLGSRVVEEILNRVVEDSGACLFLGRGMPLPERGDTISVGPLATRFGVLHVRAHFGSGRVEWTWTGGTGEAKVRAYAPYGTRLKSGGNFAETNLSAGRITLEWSGSPAGRDLATWIRDLEPRAAKPVPKGSGHRRR